MKFRYILLAVMFFPLATFAQGDYKKGYKLYKENKYAEAIPYLKTASEVDRENDEAVYYLATCYRLTNNYKDAETAYAKIVSNPEWVTASDRYYYGLMLKINGKPEEALRQFEQYQREKPADPVAKKMVESCKFAISLKAKDPNFEAQNMTSINSNKDDFAPSKYNNGIIFASSREGTTGTKNSKRSGQPVTDLFYADRFNEKSLGVPKPFSETINTKAEEAATAYDGTNRILYFTRTVTVKNNPDLNSEGICKNKIFFTKLEDGSWTKPEELPFNNNKYNVAHPTLSKDGKELYFCSDMSGGYGGKDIYVSYWDGMYWSDPVNLGDSVNTVGDEMFPYLTEDGTLFFSSNFHPGLGGLDLFMAQKSDKKFKKISHLGKGINSSGDDFGLMWIDRPRTMGYISSNRTNGLGYDDIYFVKERVIEIPKPKLPSFSVINGRVVEKILTVKYEGIQEAKGTIIDNATVALSKNSVEVNRLNTNYEGRFSFQLDSTEFQNNRYALTTTKTGFLKNQLEVNKADVNGKREIVVNLERVVVDDILYRYDRFFLTDSAKILMDRIRTVMVQHPEIKLQFTSHACPMGTDAYNYVLSQNRAKSVLEYLSNSKDPSKPNIDPSRISFDWYGEMKFLTDKNGKIEYHKSRRTEFKVLNPEDQFETRTDAEGYHLVQKGETLQSIAKKYNTSVEMLQKMNSLKQPVVTPAQKIKVR